MLIRCISYLLLVFVTGLLIVNDVTYGEEYLLSAILDKSSAQVQAVTGETGGFVQVQEQPEQELEPYSHHLFDIDTSLRVTSGIERKSIIVNIIDGDVRLYTWYAFSGFSMLPISALGTKYIVSSCHPPGNYTSVLVIATHSLKTDVDITFRLEGNITYDDRTYSDGDTLALSLEEYQTFTIKSDFDLTGTVVNTIQTVAVFTGTIFQNYTVTCDAHLPVQHYGQEYIVAVGNYANLYQLQIVSEHSDTQITFNNGTTVSVNENGVYRQPLTQDASLSFSSSRPVLTAVWTEGRSEINTAFVVVPPVKLFTKQTVFHIFMAKLKILSHSDANESSDGISVVPSIPVEWEEIPDSRYKVGTLTSTAGKPISITSNSSFTLLVFFSSTIYNGGYNFPNISGNLEFMLSKTVEGS